MDAVEVAKESPDYKERRSVREGERERAAGKNARTTSPQDLLDRRLLTSDAALGSSATRSQFRDSAIIIVDFFFFSPPPGFPAGDEKLGTRPILFPRSSRKLFSRRGKQIDSSEDEAAHIINLTCHLMTT